VFRAAEQGDSYKDYKNGKKKCYIAACFDDSCRVLRPDNLVDI